MRLFERVAPLRRDAAGRPIAPFPTLFWLGDPDLDRLVADLERRGWIKRLERRIAEEVVFGDAVRTDHGRYAEQRWACLSHEDQALCEQCGWDAVLRDSGVGGVADFSKIKCLHAHVAHALADRASGSGLVNAVGAWALKEIDSRDATHRGTPRRVPSDA